MFTFQPSFPFFPIQLSHVTFMGHQNSNTNALFYQNGTSIANMISNHSNGINMNSLNASPCYSTMESQFSSSSPQEIHSRNPSKQYSQGKWTSIEEMLYNEFVKLSLIKYPGINLRYSERKRRFYFNAMSSFIGTRSNDQCRSHDQKVREKQRAPPKKTSLRCKKTKKQNREQEGDDMMINFDAIDQMDMIPGRGMMKQTPGMAVESVKEKPNLGDVDHFFSFGSGEHQQGPSNDQDHNRNVGFNSEFSRSISLNDENFNLNPGRW